MYPSAQTAIDNARSLLEIIHAGIDNLPNDCRLADGISRALDEAALELERAAQALG